MMMYRWWKQISGALVQDKESPPETSQPVACEVVTDERDFFREALRPGMSETTYVKVPRQLSGACWLRRIPTCCRKKTRYGSVVRRRKDYSRLRKRSCGGWSRDRIARRRFATRRHSDKHQRLTTAHPCGAEHTLTSRGQVQGYARSVGALGFRASAKARINSVRLSRICADLSKRQLYFEEVRPFLLASQLEPNGSFVGICHSCLLLASGLTARMTRTSSDSLRQGFSLFASCRGTLTRENPPGGTVESISLSSSSQPHMVFSFALQTTTIIAKSY